MSLEDVQRLFWSAAEELAGQIDLVETVTRERLVRHRLDANCIVGRMCMDGTTTVLD
ncbi:hypothetical protein IFT73_13775 [Aeromicrobium sp. CFBP 8757]|nr:hypothetical protein [Aeromicrobium sp. CFBP 8757]MBD8607926.1 hypothetical protein [Aeromicrobium sp. CFBP 8757]